MTVGMPTDDWQTDSLDLEGYLLRVGLPVGRPMAEMKACLNDVAEERDEQEERKRCERQRGQVKWFGDASLCHTRVVAPGRCRRLTRPHPPRNRA